MLVQNDCIGVFGRWLITQRLWYTDTFLHQRFQMTVKPLTKINVWLPVHVMHTTACAHIYTRYAHLKKKYHRVANVGGTHWELLLFAPTGDCGDPGTPNNGSATFTSTTVGHTVTYTCKPEYVLSGHSSRTCQITGQWTGSQPFCARKFVLSLLYPKLCNYRHTFIIMHDRSTAWLWDAIK